MSHYSMVFYTTRFNREFLRRDIEVDANTTVLVLSKKIADILADDDANRTFSSAKLLDNDGNVVFSLSASLTSIGDLLYREEEPLSLTLPISDRAKTRYLQLVDPEYNNNKFYRMVDNGNGTFTAYYGRNGNGISITNNRKSTYPLIMFWIKHLEKINKGYHDLSEQLDSDMASIGEVLPSQYIDDQYAKITNEKVAKVVEYLQRVSRQIVSQAYQITPVMVSDKMIETARGLLDDLYKQDTVHGFNDILVDIFETIPRRMDRVASHIAKDPSEFARIIEIEEKLLSNMELQHDIQRDKKVNEPTETILDHFDLEMFEATEDEISEVKKMLDNTGLEHRIASVYRVVNKKTNLAFERYCKEHDIKADGHKLLWHGSRNENWLSIMAHGLSLRPNAQITGKMFGDGIYFAPSARKSFGYTSSYGAYWTGGSSEPLCYMGLYDTAYGKPLFPDGISHFSSYESFKRYAPDKECLHARRGVGGLHNEEIVFYNEAQVNIKYLVEFHS